MESVNPWLFSLPIIASLIGWFTNFLAIKMLFHPRNPVDLGLFELQGIFPKRQKALAEKLGKVVAGELVHVSDIKEQLNDPNTAQEVHSVIESRLDGFLKEGLKESFPMLAMFLNESTVGKIKSVLTGELESALPQVIDTYLHKLEDNLDIEKLVTEKVRAFDSDKLEQLLFSILKKEFKFIELIGAFLGFVIGLLQLALLWV